MNEEEIKKYVNKRIGRAKAQFLLIYVATLSAYTIFMLFLIDALSQMIAYWFIKKWIEDPRLFITGFSIGLLLDNIPLV